MSKKYSIIYADPPWSFNSVKTGGSMSYCPQFKLFSLLKHMPEKLSTTTWQAPKR